jgi:hypothetical protein
MMTPEQSKLWFQKHKNSRVDWPISSPDVEEMYLAFEARILQTFKRESVCNCLINVPAEKIEGEE